MLPSQPDLRPVGMTTVTVTATAPGESPVAITSALVDNRFAAGDLPIGQDVQIGVVLRDVSNRIVGVGEAGQTIDIEGDQATQISIPVRRPFVYASSGAALYSFDPTLDPRDLKFQGMVGGVSAPLFTVSVGGDRLAVISADQVQVIVSATNTVTGSIPIPAGARDAAAVPNTNKLAIAGNSGITIVDLDTSNVQTAMVGPVDRVSVGPAADGALYAYGLVGRIEPPDLPPPLDTCTGTSSIVAVRVDEPTTVAPKPLGAAVSDLAAAPDVPGVFVTLPCVGQVARVEGDLEAEIASVTLENIAVLERAAVLAVAGDRVWAAGTDTAAPVCSGTCGPSSQVACPATQLNSLAYVEEGASLIVLSIPLAGGPPIVLNAPGRRETIIDTDDDAGQHAQVLKALGAVPLDLVALPGGQYVGVVARSRYYITALSGGGVTFLPCLDATTSDWLLFDLASASVAQRVRSSCDVIVGQSTVFASWACETPAPGEQSMFASYAPVSVGALFGAR